LIYQKVVDLSRRGGLSMRAKVGQKILISGGTTMERHLGKAITLALSFFLILSLSTAAFAQSSNATLGGTVQDSTGAFIPGVTVTATNNATGIVATILTNESGTYQFASLQ